MGFTRMLTLHAPCRIRSYERLTLENLDLVHGHLDASRLLVTYGPTVEDAEDFIETMFTFLS